MAAHSRHAARAVACGVRPLATGLGCSAARRARRLCWAQPIRPINAVVARNGVGRLHGAPGTNAGLHVAGGTHVGTCATVERSAKKTECRTPGWVDPGAPGGARTGPAPRPRRSRHRRWGGVLTVHTCPLGSADHRRVGGRVVRHRGRHDRSGCLASLRRGHGGRDRLERGCRGRCHRGRHLPRGDPIAGEFGVGGSALSRPGGGRGCGQSRGRCWKGGPRRRQR